MHRFRKQHEPVAVMIAARHAVADEEARSGSPSDDPWKLPFDKMPMQKALCIEQGYLCAYCGRRIEPDGSAMNIEHWIPRSVDASQAFVWRNLLGVCPGTYDGPRTRQSEVRTIEHCDKSRTPRTRLLHHPADLPLRSLRPFRLELKGPSPYEVGIRTEAGLLAFMKQGTARLRGWLYAEDKPLCAHDGELPQEGCAGFDIGELNLNALRLVNDRATVISSLGFELARNAGQERQFIERRLRVVQQAGGKLPSFAHVEVAYLQRKARSHNLSLQ